MKLISMHIRNFKGITDFRLDLGGNNATIMGDNATGKTSVYDAFQWLLFGKDSAGASDFMIEPAGSRGQGIETSVIATLETENGVYTLERRRAENWVKERGAHEATFRGFTTAYYCDTLPMKENAYKDLIASLCPENLFKLITNPRAFPALKWQDQRATLFNICGDVPDDTIIAANPALAPLADRGRHSVEDYKKIQQARRRELNDELNVLPARISEASMAIKGDVDEAVTRENIALRRSKLEKLEADMRPATEAGTADLLAKLRNDRDALDLENRQHIARQEEAARKTKGDIVDGLRADLQVAEGVAYDILHQINALEHEDTEWQAKINVLSRNYQDAAALTWAGDICPSCKRPLPEEEIAPKRSQFNQDRAERLKALDADGQAAAARRKEIAGQLATLRIAHANSEARKTDLRAKLTEAEAMTWEISPMPGYEERRKAIADELAALEADEFTRAAAHEEKTAGLRTQAQALRDEISALESLLAQNAVNEQQRKRVDELRTKQKTVAAELESVERLISLCEDFTRAKVAAVEGSINSRFRIARWKLFEQQINGGIADCCVVTVGGVEYSDLNQGMKIAVGCDIIRTLSEHHGIVAPMFLDNAEAITRLPEMECQVIALYVSEDHKKLAVEIIPANKAMEEEVS